MNIFFHEFDACEFLERNMDAPCSILYWNDNEKPLINISENEEIDAEIGVYICTTSFEDGLKYFNFNGPYQYTGPRKIEG